MSLCKPVQMLACLWLHSGMQDDCGRGSVCGLEYSTHVDRQCFNWLALLYTTMLGNFEP